MTEPEPVAWPSRRERVALVLLVAALAAWGCLVELRGAFLKRRMTDACCFFRAGWVVRTGGDLYGFAEENGWHYIYPPAFAVLMVPLADAPPGADRAGLLPYPVSVGLWFVLSVALLAFALHALAGALRAGSADPRLRDQPARSRRWWALRVLPLLACLPPVCHTLMRGQTNLLLLALLCGSAAAALRGRSGRAGLWLSGAICLKVYPAFLLLFFLWRRDGRALAGCALGLVVGLVLVPVLVFGVPRTGEYYGRYARVLLGPALGLGRDRSLGDEILDSVNNDSQSAEAALHNALHLDRSRRPAEPAAWVRWLARGLCGLMTLLTLAAAGRRRATGPPAALFFGALVIVMLVACPVCHLHYLCLLILPVMALVAASWQGRAGLWPGRGLAAVLALGPAAYALANVPGAEVLRDLAVTLYPMLLLWGAATVALAARRRAEEVPQVVVAYSLPGSDSRRAADRASRRHPLGLR